MDIDEASGQLDDIETALQNLKLDDGTTHTEKTTHAISVLANASKQQSSIRERLADPEILRALVSTVECNLSDSLEIVDLALRCIGNACIDNDNARASLTAGGFAWARQCLNLSICSDVQLALLTAKVLYNVCTDFEPAQRRCLQERLHEDLIALYSRSRALQDEDRTLFVELLFSISNHKLEDAESTHTAPISAERFGLLVSLIIDDHKFLDLDDYAMMLETALLFTRNPVVQSEVIQADLVPRILSLLRLNENYLAEPEFENDEEIHKLLLSLSSNLTWCLSDIAAIISFFNTYSSGPFITEVLALISRANDEPSPAQGFKIAHIAGALSIRIVTAACLILGNLLWTGSKQLPPISISISPGVYGSLIKCMSRQQDIEFLHAAAGLLVQTSRASAQMKSDIGADAHMTAALESLLKSDMPELQQDAVKLLRALCIDVPANREKFADFEARLRSAVAVPEGTAMSQGQVEA